jgi:predicted dehydrogenase
MNISLEYPLGRSAHLSVSMGASRQRHAVIYGERGVIETSFPNHTADHKSVPTDIYPKLWRGPMLTQEAQATPVAIGNGFALEAQMFADIVQRGDHAAIAQAQAASMAVVKILSAVKRSAVSGQAVSLST